MSKVVTLDLDPSIEYQCYVSEVGMLFFPASETDIFVKMSQAKSYARGDVDVIKASIEYSNQKISNMTGALNRLDYTESNLPDGIKKLVDDKRAHLIGEIERTRNKLSEYQEKLSKFEPIGRKTQAFVPDDKVVDLSKIKVVRMTSICN